MTMTKTLASIVTEQKYPALGTSDDGPSMSRAMQWLANQGVQRKEAVELDLEGLRYICETTAEVSRFGDFTFGTKSGGTIQSNLDWGPFPTADEARNRCHLEFTAGDRAKLGHPLRITGPHSDMEPNKSPGYVLEQQCAAWFKSVTVVEAIGQDLDHIWGDFIDIGFDAKDPRRTTKAVIIPGRWSRCGRVGFNAGGTCSGLDFSCDGTPNSYIERCPGDIIHCEIQGAGGFKDWNVHDVVAKQNFRAHITGMNFCENLNIHNCLGTEFYVMVKPADGQRMKGPFYLQANHWTNPGGGLCDVYKCDQAVVSGNVGPVPKRLPLVSLDPSADGAIHLVNCPRPVVNADGLERV